MHHPKPQLRWFTQFRTGTSQSPHWLQWAPQNYPFPLTDPQTQVPASSLDPSDLPSQTASISDLPFFHNALDRQTHRQTNRWLVGKVCEFDYRLFTLCKERRRLTTTTKQHSFNGLFSRITCVRCYQKDNHPGFY